MTTIEPDAPDRRSRSRSRSRPHRLTERSPAHRWLQTIDRLCEDVVALQVGVGEAGVGDGIRFVGHGGWRAGGSEGGEDDWRKAGEEEVEGGGEGEGAE